MDEQPNPPKAYTTREELTALARFARQIERLSPAGRAWLGSYLASLDADEQ